MLSKYLIWSANPIGNNITSLYEEWLSIVDINTLLNPQLDNKYVTASVILELVNTLFIIFLDAIMLLLLDNIKVNSFKKSSLVNSPSPVVVLSL